MSRANWELPDESRGVRFIPAQADLHKEITEHLRRVLGHGESVTVKDPQRAVRIVERMGNRTEVLFMEAVK